VIEKYTSSECKQEADLKNINSYNYLGWNRPLEVL